MQPHLREVLENYERLSKPRFQCYGVTESKRRGKALL
jgi:hypothetical protein